MISGDRHADVQIVDAFEDDDEIVASLAEDDRASGVPPLLPPWVQPERDTHSPGMPAFTTLMSVCFG